MTLSETIRYILSRVEREDRTVLLNTRDAAELVYALREAQEAIAHLRKHRAGMNKPLSK